MNELYLFCARCATEVTEQEWACDACGRDTIDAGRVVFVKPKRAATQRPRAERTATRRQHAPAPRLPSL